MLINSSLHSLQTLPNNLRLRVRAERSLLESMGKEIVVDGAADVVILERGAEDGQELDAVCWLGEAALAGCDDFVSVCDLPVLVSNFPKEEINLK